MALTFSSLLKSPKFLCKYVKIYPPSTVVCYAHSQFAVQPRNVERPYIFLHDKKKKTDLKRTSGKDIQDGYSQLQFPSQSQTLHQEVNILWQNIETLEKQQKLMDESLLQKWSHDPLMDHKHLVLMVFEQDKVTGRPSFTHKENLPNSTLQEKKTFPEFSTEKVEIEKTYLRCDSKSLKGVQQVSKLHRLEENIQQVPHISPSGFALNDSISEAAMLFTNFFNDTKKQSKKKVFKTGPDPTQLSSVLLELRDEFPEFFLKKPNYTIFHQKVKFVNNITGTTTNGINPYRAQISGVRLMILSCMTQLSMEVLKITTHPNEGSIKVRWRIKGIPLLRNFVPYIGRKARADSEGYRYLDGFSVFEVGSDGLIHCHRLHKVMPSSSHEKENPLWMMFLLPFIHLLDPRSCESFGTFECRSTDKDIDPVAESDALTCFSS